jgi:hypothetical protein
MYDLDCVVVHQGEHSHTGHYFAFCRVGGVMAGLNLDVGAKNGGGGVPNGNANANANGNGSGSVGYGALPGGKWFRFDDEIVSATTTEDVLRQEAYLLFYGLRDIGGHSGVD